VSWSKGKFCVMVSLSANEWQEDLMEDKGL
jgi:hypothetical protein